MKYFAKSFVSKKNTPIFAPEFLTLVTSNSALMEAAFFVSARNSDSIDCCTLSGSRFIALLTSPNVRVQQSFFINSFLIRQMETSVRNASKAKHSTLTGTLSGAKSARIPAIAVRTGKVNRPEHLLLGEVLNYIDTAGSQQIRVIYNACGGRVDNCKDRRAAV